MDATLEQRKRDTLALLSGMLTSVLQGDFPVTNHLSAQPASPLNALLAKPTIISKTNANERDVFKIDMNDLDLGPSSESEASSMKIGRPGTLGSSSLRYADSRR